MENLSTKEAIQEINKKRLENKNKWYTWEGICNGVTVQLKAYNTWIQIFRINNLSYSSNMDISVKQYKEFLLDNLK